MALELAVRTGNAETCLDVGREVALVGASVWRGGTAGTAGVGVTGGQGVSVTWGLLSTCRRGGSEQALEVALGQEGVSGRQRVGVSSEPGSLRAAGWEKV